MKKVVCATACLLGLAAPTWAYIDASPTLGRVVKDSTNIVVLQVDKVDKVKGVILYKKVEDLKGEHPTDRTKHRITEGWHPGESKLIVDWAEPGQIAISFHNGKSAVTCIGNYWYGTTAAEPPWWTTTCGEARLAYAHVGSAQKLREHLKAMLAGKEVAITVVEFSADRKKVYQQRDIADFKNVFRGRDCPICRIKASLKMPDFPSDVKPVGPGAGGQVDVPPLIESLKSKDGHFRAEAAEDFCPADEPVTPQDLAARRLHADGRARRGSGETGFVWRLTGLRGGRRVIRRGDV